MVSPENWKRIPYYLRLKTSTHPGKSFVLFFSFCRKWLLCAQNNEINYRMIIIIMITVTLLLMYSLFLGFVVCFSNGHKATQLLSRVWLCLPWLMQNSYEFILLDPWILIYSVIYFFHSNFGNRNRYLRCFQTFAVMTPANSH